MYYKIIVLSSVTYALKAQGVLSREGIGSRLEKLGSHQTQHGCGYGLRVEAEHAEEAAERLRRENIRVIEIVDHKAPTWKS